MRPRFQTAVLLSLAAFTTNLANAGDTWKGRRVYYKKNATARVGDKIVEARSAIGFPEIVQEDEGNWITFGPARMLRKDLVDSDKAHPYFSGLVSDDGGDVYALVGLGCSEYDRKEFERSIKSFSRALKLAPGVASIYANRGFAKNAVHDFEGGLLDENQAIELDSRCSIAFWGRGFARYSLGRTKEALSDYDMSIHLGYGEAQVYSDRSSVKYALGDLPGAVEDASEAMRLDPDSVPALNNLAWIYSTSSDADLRNGKLAVKLATRSKKLSESSNAYALGTLAAAYAEVGEFDRAITLIKRAIKVTPKRDRAYRQKMLDTFIKHEPFRN